MSRAAALREPSHADASESAGIQSVEIGFALLDVLARSPRALMLRDLAAGADMSPAKAHRYLASFQRLGLVAQDPHSNQYDLGPAALRLGLASLSRMDAVKLARERAATLREQLNLTVAVAVWGNRGPTMVHWAASDHPLTVNLRLGDVMPLLTSATGRCFLTHLPPKLTDPLVRAEFKAESRHSPGPAPGASRAMTLAERVARIREETLRHGAGRVVDDLLPGVAGFCAPVFDASGQLAAGLVVLGPKVLFDSSWGAPVHEQLRDTATALSRELGWQAP
jgi:DNA-binding IclR family transcriptional regulator